MSRLVIAVIGLFLAAPSALAQGGPEAMPGLCPAPAPPSTLTVVGHGEVDAAPDRATVRFGVLLQGPDAATVQNNVNANMQKVLQGLAAVGVPARLVRTTGLNLSPLYANITRPEEANQPPHITGYQASNEVEVQVTDLQLVGKVIDAAMNGGANQINGVSFDISNDLPQRMQALQQAAQEARAKAQALAMALGVRLEGISEVVEGNVDVVRPQPVYGMMRMATATPVQPGQLKIQADVTVRYRLDAGPPRAAPGGNPGEFE